jgi:hypothetical protein
MIYYRGTRRPAAVSTHPHRCQYGHRNISIQCLTSLFILTPRKNQYSTLRVTNHLLYLLTRVFR